VAALNILSVIQHSCGTPSAHGKNGPLLEQGRRRYFEQHNRTPSSEAQRREIECGDGPLGFKSTLFACRVKTDEAHKCVGGNRRDATFVVVASRSHFSAPSRKRIHLIRRKKPEQHSLFRRQERFCGNRCLAELSDPIFHRCAAGGHYLRVALQSAF